jgi:hypothetical protein
MSDPKFDIFPPFHKSHFGVLLHKLGMKPCCTVNYDTVIIYETIQIHQITSRNFNYFIKKSIYWQIFVTNSNLPISACKLRILIYKIPFLFDVFYCLYE